MSDESAWPSMTSTNLVGNPDALGPGDQGRWSRSRAELRLARRAVWRARGASALVVTLVVLPMVGLAGGLTVWASRTPTVAQEVAVELGQTQARFEIVNGPDPSLAQSADDPGYWTIGRNQDGTLVNPELPPLEDPFSLLPDKTRVLQISSGRVTAKTAGGLGTFAVVIGEPWDPALTGRFEVLEGARPTGEKQAMVSPAVLQRLDAKIGDQLTLTEPAATFTITGVMKSAGEPTQYQEVYLPETSTTQEVIEASSWFTPDWQPQAEQLAAFNRQGIVVAARDLMLQRSGGRYVDPATAWGLAVVTIIITTFAAYLVILLAGAAFSVNARRQQRSLALIASLGAPKASIFHIVLWQGAVLGLAGGIMGSVIGIAAAYPFLVALDDGAASSFWGFHVPWWGVVGVVIFAVIVGTLAALVPARTATRGEVLSALRGARRPSTLRARRPLFGLLLVTFGIVFIVVSGIGLANIVDPDYDDPARTWLVIGIAAGPVLFQAGIIFAGHWILAQFARVGSKVGLAARLATRDTAANPSRIIPAFAAIAACVFLASFALSATAIVDAAGVRTYQWSAPQGSAYLTVYSTSSGADVLEQRAREVISLADPDQVAFIRGNVTNFADPEEEKRTPNFRAEFFDFQPCGPGPWQSPPCTLDFDAKFPWEGDVNVIAAADLRAALGTDISNEAARLFRAGGALVVGEPLYPGTFVKEGQLTIHEWSGEVLANAYLVDREIAERASPIHSWQLPAVQVTVPHGLPYHIVISPETAETLGFDAVPKKVLGKFDEPPTQRKIDSVALAASEPWTSLGGFDFSVETGPPIVAPWMFLILGVSGALILGAAGVTLGLSRIERRPDDATLTAVGASKRLRRSIAFWQGSIVVGLGAVTGTVAGVIPMWGFAVAHDEWRFSDAPWLWLLALAVGLPVVIAVVNWLVSPRRPDLTRRTAIA